MWRALLTFPNKQMNQPSHTSYGCDQVLKAMHESDSVKPAIFAMSNPTTNGLFLSFELELHILCQHFYWIDFDSKCFFFLCAYVLRSS